MQIKTSCLFLILASMLTISFRGNAEDWLYRKGTDPRSGVLGNRAGDIFKPCHGSDIKLKDYSDLDVSPAGQSCGGLFGIDPKNPNIQNLTEAQKRKWEATVAAQNEAASRLINSGGSTI